MIEALISALVAFVGWLAARGDKAQQQQIDAQKEAAALQVKKHEADLAALDAKYKAEVEELKSQNTLLFHKHDADVAALNELRVQIAEGHYKKDELDAKFERLDSSVRDGFNELGMRFDKLSEALIAHITKENTR